MIAKVSVVAICVEKIIYFLLHVCMTVPLRPLNCPKDALLQKEIVIISGISRSVLGGKTDYFCVLKIILFIQDH